MTIAVRRATTAAPPPSRTSTIAIWDAPAKTMNDEAHAAQWFTLEAIAVTPKIKPKGATPSISGETAFMPSAKVAGRVVGSTMVRFRWRWVNDGT